MLFDGVRIIDFTKVFGGPFAGRLFADWGAEVIHVEEVAHPDESRAYPPVIEQASGYFEIVNRNKKGILVDFSNSKQVNVLHNLLATSDAFLTNLLPHTLDKLQLDKKTLQKKYPSLIYIQISGDAPTSDKKYYDLLAQAESGLMSLSGNGEAVKIGPSVIDAFSGALAAFALSSALYKRQKTGVTHSIDVPMLHAAVNLLEQSLIESSISGVNPKPPGNGDSAIAPFGIFHVLDGYVAIAAGSDRQWVKLAKILHRCVQFDDAMYATNLLRVENCKALQVLVEKSFQHMASYTVVDMLKEGGVPSAVVRSMQDVLAVKNMYTSGALTKIVHPVYGKCTVPGKIFEVDGHQDSNYTPAPSLGLDNDAYGI